MNLVSLFVFLILFLFGNSTALNENGVKDHFYILSKAFADQISKEHRTTAKRVDFTNGDEIHHRRWCEKRGISMSDCQISVSSGKEWTEVDKGNAICVSKKREFIVSGEMAIWFDDRITLARTSDGQPHHLYFFSSCRVIEESKRSDSLRLRSLASDYSCEKWEAVYTEKLEENCQTQIFPFSAFFSWLFFLNYL